MAYDDLAWSYCFLASVSENDTEKIVLQKAFDIWDMLAKCCPQEDRYAQYRDIVKKELANL